MVDIERTVKEIMEDRLAIDQLDAETMELVADYLGEAADYMLDGPNDEIARIMLDILDKIGDEAEHRMIALDPTDFDEEIDASIDRGNTYFEMAEYVVQ